MFGSSFAPTLLVLLTWAVFAICLAAIGVLFLERLDGEVEPSWTHVFCGIWVGFALLTAALLIWHFFLPVNERALAVLAGAAIVALTLEKAWFVRLFRIPLKWQFAGCALLLAAWMANHALGPGGYDDYQYEFQAIRWYYEYPLVPGLANLHGRLGFNNSHHLVAAMLSVGPWKGAVNHVLNGFFFTLTLIFILDAIRDLANGARTSLDRSLFTALMLCPCTNLVLFGPSGSMLSTLKADVFVCIASAVLASLFLRWAATPSCTPTSRVLAATIVLIGCVVPGVKLSGTVFCLSLVAVVVVLCFRKFTEVRKQKVVIAAVLVGVVLVALVPIRGIVLSGYPFFPSSIFGLSVEWRVPVPLVEHERSVIGVWARVSAASETLRLRAHAEGDAFLREPWLRDWATSLVLSEGANIVLPLGLTLALTVLLLLRRRQTRARVEGASPGWAFACIVFASVAALIVWFLQAPAVRFAIVNVWILLGAILSWTVLQNATKVSSRAPRKRSTFVLAAITVLFAILYSYSSGVGEHLLILVMLGGSWVIGFSIGRTTSLRLAMALCLMPALFQSACFLARGGYSAARSLLWIHLFSHRTPEPLLKKTCSGLIVYDADYPDFQTPLPNTQFFNPMLRLRTGRLADGFILRDCGAAK
jgi:hypothetical protein